jgi:hypothetical protein
MGKEKVKPSFFGKTRFLVLRLTVGRREPFRRNRVFKKKLGFGHDRSSHGPVYYTNPRTEEIGE